MCCSERSDAAVGLQAQAAFRVREPQLDELARRWREDAQLVAWDEANEHVIRISIPIPDGTFDHDALARHGWKHVNDHAAPNDPVHLLHRAHHSNSRKGGLHGLLFDCLSINLLKILLNRMGL
jgi:hypothetical protein